MNVTDKITEIPGVGPKYSSMLEKIGIETVEDLIWHVPFRYEDYSHVAQIKDLIANEPFTVVGTITKIDNIFTRFGSKLTRARLEDETGKLNVIWFNQHYIKKAMPEGSRVAISGKLDPKQKQPQFTSPQWNVISQGTDGVDSKSKSNSHSDSSDTSDDDSENTSTNIIPIYNLTEGLTSKWLKQKVAYALENIEIEEILPLDVRESQKLIPRDQAFYDIHFPKELDDTHDPIYRLSFEELLFLHLRGLQLRTDWNERKNGHQITTDVAEIDTFVSTLDYSLTDAQDRVISEILKDLKSGIPMNRLLQGDVGSGKTVVATAALLAVGLSHFNAIYLAPTQILAQQHFETITRLLSAYEIDIYLDVGGEKGKKVIPPTQDKPYLIIGTHAVLYHLEEYGNIGAIIIDEQHKFGVAQRSAIIDFYTEQGAQASAEQKALFKEVKVKSKSKKKDLTPNLLTMTATPIPRSLALTFYGDLDLSVIDEMPPGRKPVKTKVVPEGQRAGAYQWIQKEIDTHGHQVFIVCPFIEQSSVEELQNVKAAEKEYEAVVEAFPKQKVALLHGRMKNNEKDEIINKFAAGEYDILVATPVIEVGIDIPNANIIVIETPERFGLASLHQLRGRVGRGGKQAYCLLIPSTDAEASVKRLKNLEKIHQGNKLAEIDIKIRGPGNMYGTEQHGYLNLRVADIIDIPLIKKTKKVALELYNDLDSYTKLKEYMDRFDYIGKN